MCSVAPRVGAWIETTRTELFDISKLVEPRVGARIETFESNIQEQYHGSVMKLMKEVRIVFFLHISYFSVSLKLPMGLNTNILGMKIVTVFI